MKVLYKKEFKFSFCSSKNSFLAIIFLSIALIITTGCTKTNQTIHYELSNKSKVFLQNNTDSINIIIVGLNDISHNIQPIMSKILSEFQLYSQGKINIIHKEYGFDDINKSGTRSQAIITYQLDTLTVPLFKQIEGYSDEQTSKTSISNFEYELITAIRLLVKPKERHIAFIEGHNELSRVYTYEAEEALSRYFNVSRGQIGYNINDLANFDAIIIAGPKRQYSTTEKYIIDQYIMRGGRVLWLIDGAYFSITELLNEGYSASIKNETNLDDMLFTYGIRINPDFIQDKQSILISNEHSDSPTPDYYTPLLNTSPDSPISRNTGYVKASFISSLDTINTKYPLIKKKLLTSSTNSRLTKIPDAVTYDETIMPKRTLKFDQKHIPTAVSLQGVFESSFTNRTIPQDIEGATETLRKSKETRMIVIASSDIIRNGVDGYDDETRVIPMGYDIFSDKQYGNKDFIINAMNWLTDNEGWMELRMK